jgi:hypothetical protein
MDKPQDNSLVSRINEILATRITMLVGTIWAFYAFVIFGLTPVLWPDYEQTILYWSNFLQLIFLPIITVGTTILSRDSDKRAREDHRAIKREFAILKETHDMTGQSLREIRQGVGEILSRIDRSNPPIQPAVAGGDRKQTV